MESFKTMLRKFAGVRNCSDCKTNNCASCSNFLADGAAFDEIEVLYRHATVGLALMSRDMRWVRINEELAEINGHSVFDHIGAHLIDLLPEMTPQIMPVMTHVFETGESVEQLEMSGYTPAHPDALRHWVTNFYPVKSAAGDVVGLLTIVIEQTAKIAARRQVARAEAQLRLALETSGIGTWSWNLSTGVMERSHMPVGALGYTEEQTGDRDFLEGKLHKDDALRLRMEIQRYLKGKLPEVDLEYRIRSAAGRWVWFRLRGQALSDEFSDGHFIVAGTYQNIDTAKAGALERELLQNLSIRLSYLRSVEEMKEVASVSIGRRLEADFVSLVTFDEEQMILRYEPHWHTDRVQPIATTLEAKALPPEITAKVFKGDAYRCDDTELGRPFGDHPAAEALRARKVRSLINVPVVEEGRLKGLYVVQCAEPRAWLDREIDFVRKVLDLLLGHIARATAEASAENSRALIDHASRLGGIAIFDYDYEGGAKYVSEGFELITGCDANAGDKFDTYFNLVHPDDIRAFRAALLKSRDPSSDGLCIHDHRIVRDEHDVRWMQFRGQNFFSEAGVVQRWLGAVVEVTENRILESNLEEAEHRYRLAGMASHDIIWDRDEVTGHCLWSIAISKVLGYKMLDDTTPLDWIFDHVHPEEKKTVESSFGRAMRSMAENWSMEYRVRKSDGSYAHVVDRCIFVRNADGIVRRAVGVMHDMSEQRAANTKIRRQQQELERVARLGTMGAMASTLAHELNQPLAAASNYLAVLQAMQAKTSGQDGQLDMAGVASKAGEQVQRAGDIIRRMREFTLTGQISSEYTSLQQVLARSISEMRLLPDAARITLARSVSERVDMLFMDPLQIEQVIGNVLKNAVEALRNTDDPRIEVTLTSSNGFADLTIADNGPGVTDEAMKDMFQPFKSTKSTGLGLGLAICRTIVEAHGGRLTVEQRTEGGACFHITLPIDN